MSTAPGWYPDPHDPSQARYWDGAAWSDQTQPLEALAGQAPDPEPPPAAPTAPARAAATPPSATPAEAPPPATPPPAPPPPGGGGGGATPPGGSGGSVWWRRPWAWGSAVAILALAIAGIAVFTLTGEAGAEVILEPTASEGIDPWTDSVATEEVELTGGELEPISGADSSVEALSGSTPELYGGTGTDAVCDAEALASFLEENPDKAQAFATVVGVDPGEVGDYVAGLTAVVLREDTRVTNHGFTDGAANPFDSVLQAGTAVMVDERGVPRVRCACGNPLSEPAATASSPDYSGAAWDGFDDRRLVAVSAADEDLDRLELVNVRTGEAYEQAVGAGGLTVEELLNLRMPPVAFGEGPEVFPAAKWVDGVHPDTDTGAEARGASIAGIDLEGAGVEGLEVQAAVGDLTGDGRDDGVVVRRLLSCGASCAESFDVVAFDSSGEVLESLHLESAGSVEGLRVVDGGFELTAGAFAEGDSNADGPSLEVPMRFEWNGSGFEEVG